MENKNLSTLEYMAWGLLGVYVAWFVVGPWLYETFFKDSGNTTEPCGCGKKGIPPEHKKLTENDITPDKRACIAVGLCDAKELFGFNIIPEAVHKWKYEIINGADKIFGKEKANKKATNKSGKKSTGRKK